MFKYLLILTLALAHCSAKFPNELPSLPGPCPKLAATASSGNLKGDVYLWGRNLFFDYSIGPTKCVASPLDKNITSQILATDNKKYLVMYDCSPLEKGHTQVTLAFTHDKNPSADVVKAIKKAHSDNGLELKHLKSDCK